MNKFESSPDYASFDDEYRLTTEAISTGTKREHSLTFNDVVQRERQASSIQAVEEQLSATLTGLKILDHPSRDLGEPQLLTLFRGFSELSRQLLQLIDAVESLPKPNAEKNPPPRDSEVGEALFPFLVRSWEESAPTDSAALLQQIQKSYLETGDPDRTKELKVRDGLRTLGVFVSLHLATDRLPDKSYYVRLSFERSAQVEKIDEEIAKIDSDLETTREANERAVSRGGKPLYPERERILEGKRKEARLRIDELFPLISDVSPLKADAALQRISITGAPAPFLLNELLKAHTAIERLIVACVTKSKGKEDLTLSVPVVREGRLSSQERIFKASEIEKFAQHPESLAQLIGDYIAIRGSLRQLAHVGLHHPACSVDMKSRLPEYLLEPFSKIVRTPQEVIIRLLKHESSSVREMGCRVLAQPHALDKTLSRWGYTLENLNNVRVHERIINCYLSAASTELRQSATTALKASPALEAGLYSIVQGVRKLLDASNHHELGGYFDSIIEDLAKERNQPLRMAGLLATLGYCASHDALKAYVRQQIPSIDKVKGIATTFSKAPQIAEITSEYVIELGHRILRSLSHSLDDYYMDEGGEELKEIIENFRYFLAHPDSLKGISGNEGIRNAIVIYGDPGVGKTHLVNCLKNELNIDLVVLSAAKKAKGEDKLDYIKKTIDEIKKNNKPTILLIDEAESTVLDRMSSAATSEDRDVTNYLLQEIDELRRKYPAVFIILATNYIERVDDAMIRPGRIDLEYEMKPISAQGRRALIQQTLINEQLNFELTEDDYKELVKMSEDFIPIRLIQTIRVTNRMYVPRMRLSDPEIVFDRELLLKKFSEERRQLEKHKQRLLQKRSAGSIAKELGGSASPEL